MNSLKLGLFLAIRQVKNGSKIVSGAIIFVMVLVFLNLVVVSGILVGLIQGSEVAFKEIRKTSAKFKVEKVYFSPYGARFVQYRFRGPSSFGLSNVLADQISSLVVVELNDQTLKFKLSFDSKDRDAEKKTKMFVESFLEIQKTQK
jgi:hypothetical protein